DSSLSTNTLAVPAPMYHYFTKFLQSGMQYQPPALREVTFEIRKKYWLFGKFNVGPVLFRFNTMNLHIRYTKFGCNLLQRFLFFQHHLNNLHLFNVKLCSFLGWVVFTLFKCCFNAGILFVVCCYFILGSPLKIGVLVV